MQTQAHTNGTAVPGWVSMAEAKRLLGCSDAWVYKLAGASRIAKQEKDGGNLYNKNDIEKYLGVPKAAQSKPVKKPVKKRKSPAKRAVASEPKKPATVVSAGYFDKVMKDTKARFHALMAAFDADVLTVPETMTVLRRLVNEL